MSLSRWDIAASLWLAAGRRSQWTKELASVVAWVKGSTGGLELAWDPGAGENWAEMLRHEAGSFSAQDFWFYTV